MSVSNVSNSQTQVQALAKQIANAVDANKDGQVSVSEFGDFLSAVLANVAGARTASLSASKTSTATLKGAAAARDPLGFTPKFFGFDPARATTAVGTLKYDAYNLLQNYDPHDPVAMKEAFTVLDAMHPGQYELDAQDNLMLTGTSDGYIGARPLNRDSDWNDRKQEWGWSWFWYNAAHPGPDGETA